jgi:hypothetical protein
VIPGHGPQYSIASECGYGVVLGRTGGVERGRGNEQHSYIDEEGQTKSTSDVYEVQVAAPFRSFVITRGLASHKCGVEVEIVGHHVGSKDGNGAVNAVMANAWQQTGNHRVQWRLRDEKINDEAAEDREDKCGGPLLGLSQRRLRH